MTVSVRSVLLNGQPGPIRGTIPATGVTFYTPRIRGARSAQEVVWKICVESVLGSPTTASLAMAFQAGISTSQGNQTPPSGVGDGEGGNRYYFTDVAPQYQTLNDDEHGTLLKDGDFPIVLADQTLAAPKLFIKRVVGGFDQRLAITPTYSGGTSPQFIMTIEIEVRY